MSAQNSAGIQTLLDAERDAQKIVQKAREFSKIDKDRTKRVKEARDEAKKEIDAYKKAKDDELLKFESQHAIDKKNAENEALNELNKKIIEIEVAGKNNHDKVVQDLLDAVFKISPAVPQKLKASN